MSADAPVAREISPTAQLFQKAHQKMSMLGRIDEQIVQLLGKRKGLQEELRAVQAEINEEFERLIKAAEEPPAMLKADKIELLPRTSGNGKARFAADPIEADTASVG